MFSSREDTIASISSASDLLALKVEDSFSFQLPLEDRNSSGEGRWGCRRWYEDTGIEKSFAALQIDLRPYLLMRVPRNGCAS